MKPRLLRRLLTAAFALAWLFVPWGSVEAQINTESRSVMVMAWGDNAYGQTNAPTDLSNVVALAAGDYHTAALRLDSTLVTWGSSGEIQVPAGLSNVIAIAAGAYFTVALKSDRTVVAWGGDRYGQTNVPSNLSNVVAIAAGTAHSLAVKQDGTVIAWGRGGQGQTAVPIGLRDVVSVAAGNNHSIALKYNGTIVGWGANANGEGTADGLSNVVAIAAGDYHSVALKADGTVVAWGYNEFGQTNVPVGLSNVVAIAAGGSHTVALKNSGEVVAWGSNSSGQTNVPASVSGVLSIAAGGDFTVVIGRLKPSIGTQPDSQTVTVGQSTSFKVAATGSGPLRYQWFKDATDIPGATTAEYFIPTVGVSHAGNYSVVVNNSEGSVTSAVSVLTVMVAPVFAVHPIAQTVGVGSNVTLSATAYGVPPLVFQWHFKGSPVGPPTAGTNISVLAVTNVQTNQSGNYSVQVFNAYGSATSLDAALNVVVFPPSIVLQPSEQNPPLGGLATFTVAVAGTPPFRYQWRLNGTEIPSATNAAFTIPVVAQSDAGNYSVVVSNSSGSVTSENATLSVIVRPSLGLQLLAGYPVLRLNGMLGSNFSVQYVADLSMTNWLNLRSISNLTVSPFQFLDAAGGTSPARYYRAVMQ